MENGQFYAILIPVVLSLVILCVMLYLIYVGKDKVETFIKNNSSIIDTINSLSDADEITGLISSVNSISAKMPSQEEIASLTNSVENISSNMPSQDEIESLTSSVENISSNMPSQEQVESLTSSVTEIGDNADITYKYVKKVAKKLGIDIDEDD